ncbi:hypothetical protein [Jeotgalibacillus soli]|uniref:Uncharacterized protein n=1 Tax=Jeotgalibacillus soli TaxID=889306 RepID=A0A0C2RTL0_9BACL|nr:hypothetical protein [Jeotgalibacillus soli]KIL45059.1 hypothetical protein KP78_26030 [Jeotgalibacillus soli]
MRKLDDFLGEEMDMLTEDYVTVTADDENFYSVRRENLHQLVSLGYKQIQ